MLLVLIRIATVVVHQSIVHLPIVVIFHAGETELGHLIKIGVCDTSAAADPPTDHLILTSHRAMDIVARREGRVPQAKAVPLVLLARLAS